MNRGRREWGKQARLALDQPCELPEKFGIYSKDNEKALEKVLSREITESSS